jgi:DNA uptake protein ComE-like DNA-binding protein
MRKRQLVAGALIALLAASCSAGPTDTPPAATTMTTAGAAGGSGATTAATAAKVSANNASEAELVAALTAAGVSNAQRWAGEIAEYRPYDTGDASLAKLRKELSKYNPGADTLNKILSVLQP